MATKKKSPVTKHENSRPELATKLYRSSVNKVIAGVAGGIGEYSGVDPSIIRVLFVVLAIFGGSGVVLYLILWIILPTQSSIPPSGTTIKNNVAEMRVKAKEFASSMGLNQRNDNRSLWPLILIIIGVIFLLNNFGFYHVDFERLWPIWLILGGILLLRRR